MIEIDGSHGEGGGQILRTAVAMAAVLGESVKIRNIRAGRSNPGLSPQHVTSIEAVAEFCGAETDGVFPGSRDVSFNPGPLIGGEFEFDVGTAGSISLIMQSCLIPAVLSKSSSRIILRGGTDVRWAPPIDYMRFAHLQILSMFGPSCDMELGARGFYPEGGGEVTIDISPVGGLRPVALRDRGRLTQILGVAYSQNLPEHVATRMKHSALKTLIGTNDIKIDIDLRRGPSTGAGIVLGATYENTVLAESAIGARGIRSETLGEQCAQALLEVMGSGATVDEHMTDQMLPYMALARPGSTVLAEELTSHAETNIWLVEQFMGKKFEIEKRGGLIEIVAV